MKRLSLFVLCLGLTAFVSEARPMKSRVIQQAYSPDGKDLQKNFDWTIDALRRCDPSLDIVVLPETASIPGKTFSLEEYMRVGPENTRLLLEACSETARRCSTLVFAGAPDFSLEVPRNTIFVFDRTGNIVGKYYKQHLVRSEWKFLDKSYTEEWEQPYILEIEGLKFAFMICYDFYFYENYANIARWKPDIIIGCSHQRSDTFRALDLINAFCAYHTGAYVVRASVSMGPDSELGGCSCVAAPTGEILATLRSEVATLDVTFDPSKKYLKPAGYGNPPAMHSEYIDLGRRPWKYRPGGSAIVPPLSEAPSNRSVVTSNDMATLGAAVATGTQEICITLDSGADWEPFLKDVLKHFSCHVIMNIRLKGAGWDEASIARVKDLVFIYDAQGHVYYTKM
ncbi:MAG: carbon-nitrogen hydrolase family protein [Bacteroidales bacterium]|nr:carbon-nitrogen hydrolase family protein [Bacteroidales bacterium]